MVSQAAIDWLRTRIGWAAAQVGEETAKQLAQALSAGLAAGESIDDIAARIGQVFDMTGDRAQLIARTETIAASAQGAIEGYGASGVVDKVEFYAAQDERECEDCAALNGEMFAFDLAPAVIPVHPNCRCVWLPVIK